MYEYKVYCGPIPSYQYIHYHSVPIELECLSYLGGLSEKLEVISGIKKEQVLARPIYDLCGNLLLGVMYDSKFIHTLKRMGD